MKVKSLHNLIDPPNHKHDEAYMWPSSAELDDHLRKRHGIVEYPQNTLSIGKFHDDLHAGYDTDPERTALAEVRAVLDAELWVLKEWDNIPREHRVILLQALTHLESMRLAIWRSER